jgi:hypothetical protein
MQTIKVRIAVAVNEKGEWNSAGWNHHKDDSKADNNKRSSALEGLEPGRQEVVYFIEAEVPIPESIQGTIQGEVKEGWICTTNQIPLKERHE